MSQFPAEAYEDLVIAYLEMHLFEEAAKIVREGLKLYPSDAALQRLAKDDRLQSYLDGLP